MNRRPSKRTARVAQRRQAAAINLAGAGLLFVVLPHLLPTVMAVAVRPLSLIGWLLLVVGIGLIALQRRSATRDQQPPAASPDLPRAREPRRPARPLPPVERIEPVATPATRHTILEPHAPAVCPRPTLWGPEVFAVIEWRRFEAVVEALFAQAGFLTKAQSHGPDEGVDVWLHSKHQPDGAPVSVVQCKHWGRNVGVDKVRELRGVMAAKGVTRGQFATTASFTPDAIAFAAANSIKLHDGAGLLALIGSRTAEQQQVLLDVALDGDYWRPTCVNCGIKLVERAPSAGGKPFWGCTNFPKCRTTMAIRAG